MQSSIVVVLGYPGTGKLTVSRELVRQVTENGSPIRLIDNHSVSDLLFPLIAEADGKTPLPAGIFERVREINLSILKTIGELSPPEWSFVLTHHLPDNDSSRDYLSQLEQTARHRHSRFVSIVLTCALPVLLDRVTQPDRQSRKLTDPAAAIDIIENGMLTPSGAITIEVSDIPPTEAAQRILTIMGATTHLETGTA